MVITTKTRLALGLIGGLGLFGLCLLQQDPAMPALPGATPAPRVEEPRRPLPRITTAVPRSRVPVPTITPVAGATPTPILDSLGDLDPESIGEARWEALGRELTSSERAVERSIDIVRDPRVPRGVRDLVLDRLSTCAGAHVERARVRIAEEPGLPAEIRARALGGRRLPPRADIDERLTRLAEAGPAVVSVAAMRAIPAVRPGPDADPLLQRLLYLPDHFRAAGMEERRLLLRGWSDLIRRRAPDLGGWAEGRAERVR